MKKATYIEMEYSELQALVQKEYGAPHYNFVVDVEGNNDSVHRFYAEKKELDDYELEQLTEFKASGGEMPGYMTYILLQDLVNREVLEPGDYLVEVCW